MLIIAKIISILHLNLAMAAGVCGSIFDFDIESTSIENRINLHNYQIEIDIHGIPQKDVYMKINPSLQFRNYLTPEGLINLKLVKKYPLPGSFTKEEAMQIKDSFPPYSIDLAPIESGLYQVYKWHVIQDVHRDFNTELIKADEYKIRIVIDRMVQAAAKQRSVKKAILFLDIDNLGLVNELPGSHKTGDAYIKLIIDIISKNLRSHQADTNSADKSHSQLDIGFKNYNGDEFFYVLNGIHSAKEIKDIKNRIQTSLKNSHELQALKQRAVDSYMGFLDRLTKIKSYKELSSMPSVLSYIKSKLQWLRLTREQEIEIEESNTALQKFLKNYSESFEAQKVIDNILMAELGASFAIQIIKEGDNLDSILARADHLMKEEKAHKKASSKYSNIQKNDIYFPVIPKR